MTDNTYPKDFTDPNVARKQWLRVLALTSLDRLAEQIGNRLETESFTWLRQPETGLYRVQGRLDVGGNRFNLADIVVTRCVVRSEYETAGVGYVQGRSTEHSTLVARIDSLLQCRTYESALTAEVIKPLAEYLQKQHCTEREQVDRSRVQFYTMTPETV